MVNMDSDMRSWMKTNEIGEALLNALFMRSII